MKQLLTKYSGLAAILFIVMFVATTDMQAAQKRVLIEQHTGSWCGWCPDGSYMVEQVIREFPDQIIGVKWHAGDAMALPLQQTIAQTFGFKGYPSATVDRKPYMGSIALGRNYWRSAAVENLSTAPIFDLQAEYSYNATTEIITATITATVVMNDPRQFAFNLYIMEDKCTGTGDGWDQINNLSNMPGYENNPYYKKPSRIVGYEHMSVVRHAFGGAYGDTQKFLKGVKVGEEYTQTFTIKKASNWNQANLYIVGLVQAFVVQGTNLHDGSIINAVEVGKKMPAFAALEVPQPYSLMTLGSKFTQNITVSNPQDFPIDVSLSIDPANSKYPSNWVPTLSQTTVTLPAKGKTEVQLNLTAPVGKAQFAEFAVKAVPVAKQGMEVVERSVKLGTLTDNTKHVVFGLNPNSELFVSALAMNMDYGQNIAYLSFPLNNLEKVLNTYNPANFDFVSFSTNFAYRGIFSWNFIESNLIRNYLKDAVSQGKKILLSSEVDMVLTFHSTDGSADAKDFFGNTLGIGSQNQPKQVVTRNAQGYIIAYLSIDARGVNNDPIGNGLNFSINRQAATAPTKRVYYCEDLTATAPASVVMNYVDGAGNVTGGAAVKTQVGKSRVVYLGFNFEAADDQVKSNLAKRIMDWLFAEPTVNEPNMTLSTQSLNYGIVNKGENKTMQVVVTNIGKGALNFNKIEIANDQAGVFTITEGGQLTSLGENGTRIIEVKFSPDYAETKTTYTANLVIQTNDPNNPNANVSLEGIGDNPASIGEISTPDGLFVMSLGPNPIVSNSVFNFTINGTNAQNLVIRMIDATGRTIQHIANGSIVPGTYNAEINSGNLTSGSYFIVAEVNGVTTTLPVAVVK